MPKFVERAVEVGHSIIEIMGNIPQAMMGFGIVASLFIGGTSLWGVITPEVEREDADAITQRVIHLERQLGDLTMKNEQLRKFLVSVIAAGGLTEEVCPDLGTYIVELPSGEITPLK